MKRLLGKVAIVTGANRGIGKGIALRLAEEGALVVLAARDESLLKATAEEIGDSARWIAMDLRQKDAPARAVEYALEQFGRLDIVVNNAGATKRGEFEDLTDDDFLDGFALKFFGAVRLARAAWPHLKTSQGSLVNIAGAGGKTPGRQFTIGGSVNAALLSFTKAMADLGIRDKVQVNLINPGTVRTDRFQKRLDTMAREQNMEASAAEGAFIREQRVVRIGEPQDIAALVAFIVSREGSFLQGALIDMDGGVTKSI